MSRDGLTAEQRPDKNGNLVTRWVRERFGRKDTSQPLMPPPTVVPVPSQSPVKSAWVDMNSVPGHIPNLRFIRMNIHMDFERHESDDVEEVFDALVANGVYDPSAVMNEDMVTAYAALKKLTDPGWATRSDEHDEKMRKIGAHLVMNLDDYPVIEEIIKREVALDRVLETLEIMKNDDIAKPLSDGFL